MTTPHPSRPPMLVLPRPSPRATRSRRTTLASLCLCLCLCLLAAAATGCEDEASKDAGDKATERAAVDPARTIRVELRHPPDEAFKDAIYRIEYRPGEGYDLDAKLLDPLLAAARAGLVPSDGLKSCRYSENLPRLEIFVPKQDDAGSALHLISSSQCQDFAPWNVVVDGKLHVQLDGAIGRALQPVLVELDSPRFEHYRWPREGRFELTESVAALPEGVSAQTPPWLGLGEQLASDPAFRAAFGEEAKVDSLRVLCSQTVSATCAELLGQARLPWRGHTLELASTLTLDKVVSVDMPATTETFDALLGSKLFAAFTKSAGTAPITLAYDKRGDCRNLEHGAAVFAPDQPIDSLACEYYSALVEHYDGATVLPPQLFYFPALGAARLNNWADKTDQGFYASLGADAKIMETILLDKVRFFATLDGKLHEIEK